MNLKRFKKRSKYNVEKNNKVINYSHLNKNYCIPNQTVLAGDSITEICNMELYSDYEKRNSIIVYNRGISGDTSDRFLERLQDNVLILNPKNIVYLIGTNDLSIGADAQYVADNINSILKLSREKCPNAKIILLTVFPVGKKCNRKNKNISKLNALLPALEEKYGITLLDLTNELSDSSGYFNEKYTYDGLHPNVFGYEIITKRIIQLLEK